MINDVGGHEKWASATPLCLTVGCLHGTETSRGREERGV